MLYSLFVGIDVSAKDNKVQLLKSDGSEVLRFSVPNSLPGAKILSDKVVSAMSKDRYDSLVVDLEATSVYGDHLVYFLKEDASINRFKPKLHVLNSKQVANFKKAYPEIPKNDWVDA
ncbi:MAG: IS110 family transposase [Caulobacteraceae bacterium]